MYQHRNAKVRGRCEDRVGEVPHFRPVGVCGRVKFDHPEPVLVDQPPHFRDALFDAEVGVQHERADKPIGIPAHGIDHDLMLLARCEICPLGRQQHRHDGRVIDDPLATTNGSSSSMRLTRWSAENGGQPRAGSGSLVMCTCPSTIILPPRPNTDLVPLLAASHENSTPTRLVVGRVDAPGWGRTYAVWCY